MERITDVLCREHRTVLEVLNRLERAIANRSTETLSEVVLFFTRDLTLHRRKEEEVLFPEIAHRLPPNSGPVQCMLEEHAEERWHVEVLRRALAAGDFDEIVKHGSAIVVLLRNHIWKEENVLFPMADEILEEDARERVRCAFLVIGCCAKSESPPSPHGEYRSEDSFDPY